MYRRLRAHQNTHVRKILELGCDAMITKLFLEDYKLNQSCETCAAHIAKADHACEISNACQITNFISSGSSLALF